MDKAYSNDLRERVIKNYLGGMTKEDIVNIYVYMNRHIEQRIKKYKKQEVLILKSKKNSDGENSKILSFLILSIKNILQDLAR